MSLIDTFLICISHNNLKKGNYILNQYINSDNYIEGKLLFIENGSKKKYEAYKNNFKEHRNIEIYYSNNPNKAYCINYLIYDKIINDEALIVCIDDDISFPNDFLNNYKKVASNNKSIFFFGGSMKVDSDYNKYVEKNIISLYQQSQFSKSSQDFLKSKNMIFLGCNYAFFKSQWKWVNGLDERFGPGTEYGLAAEESVFQKKLKYVGYKPFFLNDVEVNHYPEIKSYNPVAVKERTKNNGYTHGFLKLINSNHIFKYDYLYQLGGMFKSILEFKFKNKKESFLYKKHYCIGYLNAFLLYIKINNNESIFKGLKKLKNK